MTLEPAAAARPPPPPPPPSPSPPAPPSPPSPRPAPRGPRTLPADPAAAQHGAQWTLRPPSEAHAPPGSSPSPYANQGTAGTLGKRCQVPTADIDPAQNTGALYFADSHYVVPDDARYT